MQRWLIIPFLASFFPLVGAFAEGPTAALRGELALTMRPFLAAFWSMESYGNAWKHWGQDLKERPADYDAKFRERYGLHEAPYPSKYPMGLREAQGLLGKGMAPDCMMCHAGSIMGKSIVGLGNTSLDVDSLFDEMTQASGISKKLPFTFSNARGTSEAGGMAVYLLTYREPDLKIKFTSRNELPFNDNMCEDTPAWWHLKKKKTMYHVGSTNARSVRSIMQFMLSPPTSLATFEKEEAAFRDIQAYLLSLTPPKYPFPIDQAKATQGGKIFKEACAKCHGTYGENWTYPNKIVPIDEIGTDRARYLGISEKAGDFYNKSWFAKEKRDDGQQGYPIQTTKGYQAPPLDGIWATAPYLHNGSVPTLQGVLNSKARPKIFTRSFKTDADAYDATNVGWKVQVLERGPDPKLPGIERRRVYDTTQPGRGNSGHTFGDDLTEVERRAVIEYLKTL